jgi:hypothetical protein
VEMFIATPWSQLATEPRSMRLFTVLVPLSGRLRQSQSAEGRPRSRAREHTLPFPHQAACESNCVCGVALQMPPRKRGATEAFASASAADTKGGKSSSSLGPVVADEDRSAYHINFNLALDREHEGSYQFPP